MDCQREKKDWGERRSLYCSEGGTAGGSQQKKRKVKPNPWGGDAHHELAMVERQKDVMGETTQFKTKRHVGNVPNLTEP